MSPLFATLIGLRPTANIPQARPTDVVLAISPLFSMLMGLLTLAVAKMPKLSLPPLAAMSPQLTILTGLSPNLVSTLKCP
jgi:hypothetical protein